MKDLLNMIGDGVFSRFESSLKKKNSTSKIKSSFADSSNLKTQSNFTLKTQSVSASEKNFRKHRSCRFGIFGYYGKPFYISFFFISKIESNDFSRFRK